jgi:hypothetical protein
VRGFALLGSVFVLLVLAGGCQIFGDFEVAESDADALGCTSGSMQCVGNVLQTCNRDGDGWENAAVCASEPLCDKAAGTCRMPTCGPGERRCLDAELQICNGTRDGWIALETCATAGHCSTQDGGCMDVPCAPGEIQCNGPVLQSCSADQSSWNIEKTCESAALCNEIEGVCDNVVCSAGTFQCLGAQLQSCNLSLDGWTTIGVCDSAALCNESTGTCGQGSCTTPGVFRCSEAGVLEQCLSDLTGWALVDTCDSEAHCDAVSGTCMEEPCTVGAFQCSGATLEVCRADRTGRDPVNECETEGLCQLTLSQGSTECVEPVCEVGDLHCEGAQPQICNADRTGYRDNGATCASVELCNDVMGACDLPVCEPGQTRCTGAQPETCNEGLTGYVPNGSACASSTLCNETTGSCGDAACIAGQTRCDPDDPTRLQRCKDTLEDWDTCDTCATAGLCSASVGSTTCDATSCREPTCALADIWCGGSDGRTLTKCPPSRINTEPEILDVCATAELCEATHDELGMTTCIEPTCAVTDLWCGGTGNRSLYKCPPSRINSQAIALDTCETNGLCEQAHSQGAMSCPDPACAVGQTQCGGTGNRTLRMCRNDRTGYMDCDACDSSALCTDSLTATTCDTSACHVCLAGQKQCMGSQLQVCNATHNGWTNLALCGSSALCTNSLTPASQTTCDACVAGSHACDGAQPQACSDPGTGPAVWEDDGAECDAATLCDPARGACICSLGETRCNPTSYNFETCEESGWVETAECSMGCDDTSGCL